MKKILLILLSVFLITGLWAGEKQYITGTLISDKIIYPEVRANIGGINETLRFKSVLWQNSIEFFINDSGGLDFKFEKPAEDQYVVFHLDDLIGNENHYSVVRIGITFNINGKEVRLHRILDIRMAMDSWVRGLAVEKPASYEEAKKREKKAPVSTIYSVETAKEHWRWEDGCKGACPHGRNIDGYPMLLNPETKFHIPFEYKITEEGFTRNAIRI